MSNKRFTKAIKALELAGDALVLVDSTSGDETFAISGQSILGLVSAMGEDEARATILAMVEAKYPNLSTEEIKELFA